ncbi:MAG: hypothetical protein ORO03_07060 [Alphaproteobacteria bacterium]|nr:hypothetical protein [Alphaproteobacteria bacterium]
MKTDMIELFSTWVDQVMSRNAQGDYREVGGLKPHWVEAIQAANIALVSATIIVRDHDVKHSFRDAKDSQLPLDWYKQLPEQLIKPQAVILDQTKTDEPAILLLYGLPNNRAQKLVVRINYYAKIKGKKQRVNLVNTGHISDLIGLKGKVSKELLLIEGSL